MSYIITPPANKGVLSTRSFPLILTTGGIITRPSSSLSATSGPLIMGFNPAVHNGGFETPGAGPQTFDEWDENMRGGAGTITLEAIIVHDGLAACKLQTDIAGIFPVIFQTVGMIDGKRYTLSFWARGAIGGESISVLFSSHYESFILTNVYHRYYYSVIVNPLYHDIQLYGGSQASDVVYIDSVQINPS